MAETSSPTPAELAARTFAFAGEAEAQKDWPQALERWNLARRSFPDQTAGYIGAAVALRELGRFDDAEALLGQAIERFPHDSGPWVGWAALPHGRGDWAVAAQRWGRIRARFPQEAMGYSLGVVALRALGRTAEAELVLAAALEHFPDEGRLRFEYAVAAAERADWRAAAERWEVLRSHLPDQPAGYVGGAAALREQGRFAEAEALLADAVTRFPEEQAAIVAHGWSANHRRDWPEAVRRWEVVRRRYPDAVDGYCGAAQALRQLHRFDEAQAIIAEAMQRLPASPEPYVEHAWIAHDTRDWPEAVRRWEMVRGRLPDHVPAYAIAAEALAKAGRFDEAEALVAEAGQRFPDTPLPFAAAARVAEAGRRWPEAAERWREAQQRFPAEAELALRLHEAELRLTEAAGATSRKTSRRSRGSSGR
ncbi:MAG TPA: tetratricopeptide repeat protein [Stellaceae bacterium]|nr:tetratricopeptide repeat protein [Stellaceae bacterium]